MVVVQKRKWKLAVYSVEKAYIEGHLTSDGSLKSNGPLKSDGPLNLSGSIDSLKNLFLS